MTVVAPPASDPTRTVPERRAFTIRCANPACGHTFTRRLAKGHVVTCPACKVTQPGPARLEELERREILRLERNRRRRERYRAEANGNGGDPEPPPLDHDGDGDQPPPPPSPEPDPAPPASSAPPPRAPSRWSMRGLLTGDGW